MRQQAEDEVSQLKSTLQGLQTRREELEQLVQQLQSVAHLFEMRLLKCYDGLGKILPVLEEMRPELLMGTDNMSLTAMPSQLSLFSPHQFMED
jgi:chromosome segregation ATPase